MMNDYIEEMNYFEATESCSGLCETGLFWFTKSVTLDSPSDSCFNYSSENIAQSDSKRNDLLTKL
tara:strand:+ start:402 stop:596 length:195 start_codon:yes stop_codon:yes gene_type:complete